MKVKLTDYIENQYGISKLPENPVYTMAYVPFQAEDSKLYSPDQGLAVGTMYQALNKPFCGSKCGDKND